MVVEIIFLEWKKTTVFLVLFQRKASAIADAAFAVAYSTPIRMVLEYAFSFGLAYAGAKLVDHMATWYRWELPSNGLPEVLFAFAIYYLTTTFVSYWHHRLMHWRWFWYLHRFHHSTPELNLLTGYRENPGAALLNLLPALSPLVFFKLPDAGLFASFVLVYQILAALQHSQLPWTFGWFGRWIMVSPAVHQIHHSVDDEHRDLNYSVCPLWDRLFGTWYAGSNRPSAYGISDPAHIERPFTQWLIDVWIFYRDFARSVRSALRRKAEFPPPAAESGAVLSHD